MPTVTTTREDSLSKMAQNHPHDFTKRHNIKTRFPEPFVREIEERFGDCLDTDYGAGRGNGMSGIVAGKQPNEAERVDRGERAPRCGLDCRPKNFASSPGPQTVTRSDLFGSTIAISSFNAPALFFRASHRPARPPLEGQGRQDN
jgi:hypothetical protein